MAGEGQTRSSDEALSADVDSVTLGLIPAPEMPEEIAAELSTELPELLSQGVDGRVSWEGSVVCDPLSGSDPDAVRVIDAGHERMVEEGWDLALCLTDLPLRTDGRERRSSSSSTSCTRGARSLAETVSTETVRRWAPGQMPGQIPGRRDALAQGPAGCLAAGSPNLSLPSGGTRPPTMTRTSTCASSLPRRAAICGFWLAWCVPTVPGGSSLP